MTSSDLAQIFHADGTFALRNPTREELEQQLIAEPQRSQHGISVQAAKEDLRLEWPLTSFPEA